MKQLTTNTRRGLTLTELLAVMMIISLLATIAVPVYVSRQEDARIRVAMGEAREIAMAQENVAVMHGFYVPLQILDELPARTDNTAATGEERIDQHRFVGNGAQDDNIYLIIPTIPARDQVGRQLTLANGVIGNVNFNPLVRKLIENWSGPYITWHRYWYDPRGFTGGAGYDGPHDPRYRNTADLFKDYPLDPWGNPYRFYSPIGIIGNGNDERGADFNFETPNPNFSNGWLRDMSGQDEGRRFQRYAIVSYGRDGLSDYDGLVNPNIPDNDIVYEFGTDGVGRNFGKF